MWSSKQEHPNFLEISLNFLGEIEHVNMLGTTSLHIVIVIVTMSFQVSFTYCQQAAHTTA